jgi:predicted GNAT superfamily acetyltransferase
VEIRPVTVRDRAAVLALNTESEWATTPLDASSLEALLAMADPALVATSGDEVLGFALALPPGRPYDSANYRWFAARYDDFLYLDRVAVGERHRRRGVGGAIYEEMELRARPPGRMLCEVNLEPPNHPSLAFHSARGYEPVGRLDHGGKTVVMLAKELASSPGAQASVGHGLHRKPSPW